MSYKQIRQRSAHTVLFEYNALVNAVRAFWKTTMDNNSLEVIIPQEIVTEIGPLSNLSNKLIIK